MKIKMSIKTLLLQVIPCESFLKDGVLSCGTPCCFHKAKKTTKIVFFDEEIKKIKENFTDRQFNFNDNLLIADNNCPFLQNTGLCELHNNGMKPLCCTFSPFTFNKNGTLIYRYRYYQLPCYRNKELSRVSAYKAFKSGLILVFGAEGYDYICSKVDEGNDFHLEISDELYNKIIAVDNQRKKDIKEAKQ